MAEPNERQLLNQAYRRYRLASQYAGYAPLPFPDWLQSLKEYELVTATVDSALEAVLK